MLTLSSILLCCLLYIHFSTSRCMPVSLSVCSIVTFHIICSSSSLFLHSRVLLTLYLWLTSPLCRLSRASVFIYFFLFIWSNSSCHIFLGGKMSVARLSFLAVWLLHYLYTLFIHLTLLWSRRLPFFVTLHLPPFSFIFFPFIMPDCFNFLFLM